MATTYSILMKDRKLTTKILIQKLENMGYICGCIKELPKGIEIDLQEKLGSSIYLIIAGDYP